MSVYTWLQGAAQGLIEALGPATSKVELTRDPRGNGSLALIRQGYTLQKFDGPLSGRRLHNFDDVRSLAGWLHKHADAKRTEIAVGGEGAVVTAQLDPRDARGDVVSCRPPTPHHPRLARWLDLFGQPYVSQRDLHRHIVACLEDFLPATGPNGEELGSFGTSLAQQLLRVQLTKGAAVTVELDELGYTRVAGSNRETAISAKLPPRFTVRVPFFLHGPPDAAYDLEVHLSVIEVNAGVAFALDCPGLAVVRHQAVIDVATFLQELLGDAWLVGLGTLNSKPEPKPHEEVAHLFVHHHIEVAGPPPEAEDAEEVVAPAPADTTQAGE